MLPTNEKYPGWKNVANNLIDNGVCIVAGDKCIWIEGIGNFIKTKPAKNAFDCLEYTFNLKEFMKSAWFKYNCDKYFKIIREELKEIQQEVFEIEQLTTYK